MLRFQQMDRKGVYSKKREEHENKNGNEKYQMCLKSKEFHLPRVRRGVDGIREVHGLGASPWRAVGGDCTSWD